MANTLTDLYPDLYAALDVVSRELVGFVGAVSRDSTAERAALNQTVRSPYTAQGSTANNTPATEVPDTGDETVANKTITISKSKHYPVRINGEETRGLNTAGTYNSIMRDRFSQGMRTLVNEIETDIATLYKKASRAYGTAGTAPFGTADNMTDFAGVAQILAENGAPQSDLRLVLGHAAMANLRGKQSGLFHVNEAGSDELLRLGMTRLPIMGFNIHYSGQVQSHTKGAATGYDADNADAVGVETIAVAGSDSGTILPGDIVTWTGDTNKYVIASTTASAAASGNIVIGAPGLRLAMTAGDEGTTGGTYTANMAFHRGAIHLATRLPAAPPRDKATDSMIIQDPVSGLAFEIAEYPGYLQTTYHVRLAWGFELVKPAHTAILLG